MALIVEQLSIDASDTMAQGKFWAAVLDLVVDPDSDEVECYIAPKNEVAGSLIPGILFIRVPERKTIKNRLHLCLRPEDQDAEVERLEALGATRADVGQGDDVTWIVLADPEGNEFCVLSSAQAVEQS